MSKHQHTQAGSRFARSAQRWSIAAFTLVAACRYEHVDSADDICISSATAPLRTDNELDVGNPQALVLVENEALNFALVHSCDGDKDPEGSCEVSLKGSRLVVESTLEIGPDPDSGCFGSAIVNCTTPRLPAGEYVIDYGGSEWPLTIPSMLAGPCVNDTWGL